MIRSRIYEGEIVHARHGPVTHSFRYPVYFYVFDLDELDRLEGVTRLFGHNRLGPVSVRDRDYLRSKSGSIRENLMRYLEQENCADGIDGVELVTAARFMNYVFNPVSFYVCYRLDGSVRCHVAEVNNTFGESHLYVLDGNRTSAPPPPGFVAQYETPKEFHVSPFYDVAGEYRFLFSDIAGPLDIRISLHKDGKETFFSQLSGKALPFTAANLRRTLVRFPVSAVLTMPRIVWQAALLHYRRKLPVHTKPAPSSRHTIGVAPPTLIQRVAMGLLARHFRRMEVGVLTLVRPDGTRETFGNKRPGPEACIEVRDWRFFPQVITGGDVGFGEAYSDGRWDSPDMAALIRLFAENTPVFDDRRIALSQVTRWLNAARHKLRPNSKSGSRRNISFHYDLGNDFYQKFLDESMTYSCALFREPGETLAEAQRNKIGAMIARADIQPGHHVLEIGCGWGAFAIEAARVTGCRVTGITLSERQREFALARVREAGLEDRVEILLMDFRDVKGSFDRIVSIEMLEAVGHRNLGLFFETCDRLLKPDGRVAIQVITISDERYPAYRRGCDWIQKHIFPGGMVPSPGALADALCKHSQLVVENMDRMGLHYARTLREWRERFLQNLASIREMGFDSRFERAWEYYLSYCEGGFSARALDVVQFTLGRPGAGHGKTGGSQ